MYINSICFVFPVGGDRLGFGVSYSKAERLARRHRSNIGGLDHDSKKGVHPCCTRENKKVDQCSHITRIGELHLWRGWAGES